MAVVTCIEDLRVLAQRRVPRMFYDYADSGSWTESTYRANEAENRDLAFQFAAFLDALKRVERAPWTGAEGLRSWRTLGIACAACHNLYRKD